MAPIDWPTGFTYSSVSIPKDIHANFLAHLLSTKNRQDEDTISPCIDRLHTDLKIQKLEKPHPLANREVFKGHLQHGVFALKKIPSGTELGEYVGEISLVRGNMDPVAELYCWIVPIDRFVIYVNSRNISNELSFINDYRGIKESPNLCKKWIIHKGIYHFGFQATKEINEGEELLIDYGN